MVVGVVVVIAAVVVVVVVVVVLVVVGVLDGMSSWTFLYLRCVFGCILYAATKKKTD